MTNSAQQFQVGDRITAAKCGRADNVQFIRHDVTGTVERLMGTALSFHGADGSLFFAMVRDIEHVTDGQGVR